MSHERSTPPPPGTAEYVNVTPTPTQFARTPSGFMRNPNGPISPMERWAMGRSESSFNVIAGSVGGFASGVVSCPLDVIKTKLQAQGGFRTQPDASNAPGGAVYKGMFGTARVIWKEEGIRGMYRGLGPIILGYLPTWAVWFTVYGKSKEYFSRTNDNQFVVNFWSSIVAGASSTMVTNPIWVIKTRLMSQVSQDSAAFKVARPPWHYRSTMDAARKMYRTEGVLSFYSGLTPALLGLTHVAIQFPAYEYLKTKFTGRGMGVQGDDSRKSDWLGIFSASVLSKVLASSATYPHEVIRTRLQTQQRSMPSNSVEYTAFRGGLESSHGPSDIVAKAAAMPRRYKGIVTTFKTILKEEGWRAFYAGMGTNMMRAVPAATTTLITYEYVMKYLNNLKSEGIRKQALMDDKKM